MELSVMLMADDRPALCLHVFEDEQSSHCVKLWSTQQVRKEEYESEMQGKGNLLIICKKNK